MCGFAVTERAPSHQKKFFWKNFFFSLFVNSHWLGQITYIWNKNDFLLHKVDHKGKNVKLSKSAVLATLEKFFYWSISAQALSGPPLP